MRCYAKIFAVIMLFALLGCAMEQPSAQQIAAASQEAPAMMGSQAFGVKSYFVNPAFYPYVMVYFKTTDANGEPLVNLNPMNIGLMIQGKAYDMSKRQYAVQSMGSRNEGFRTVLVIDASGSVADFFGDIKNAASSYIRLKKPNDEVAIIALGDSVVDVCAFTKDANRADLYLRDVKPTGSRTPLYDGIARAIAMCHSAAGITSTNASDYIVQSNIVVISDCMDEHSMFTRENILGKVASMSPPVPIYSMAYVRKYHQGHKDMAAISTASFGRFFPVNSASSFVRISDKIQSINRSDYVLTFRAYQPVDGNRYSGQVVVNYEGRGTHDEFTYQTMQPPLITPGMREIWNRLNAEMPPVPDSNPYMTGRGEAPMQAPVQQSMAAPAAQQAQQAAPAMKSQVKKKTAAKVEAQPQLNTMPSR